MKHDPQLKTIGGVTFEDPFAWLQPDSDEALDWQWARDAEAQADVRAWPGYETVRQRLASLDAGGMGIQAPRRLGGLWFMSEPHGSGTAVIASDKPAGPGRAIVTSAEISSRNQGAAVMMTWIEPSPHGTYLAVAYGVAGDMKGAWAIYEVSSGRHLIDVPALAYTGARPGWLPDESGFFLDGRDEAGLHALRFVPVAAGAKERPTISIPETLVAAKHSGLTAQLSPSGRHAVIVTEPHEHLALVLLDVMAGTVSPFMPLGREGECDGSWLDDDIYIARVTDGSPRGRVVAIPVATSTDPTTWRELVPTGEGFLNWAGVVAGRLYVGDLVDVSLRVRIFDLTGKLVEELPLEPCGSSPSMFLERAIRPTEALAFTHATFAHGPALFVHDAPTGELQLITPPAIKLDNISVEPAFATSRDGTRIPYFLVRKANLDPSRLHPAAFYGYGGFNVALLPAFPKQFVPFIEAGGVYVHCCLRGGSEYGKAWHDSGRLANKQNTFDDLFAIAEKVIADGVSKPELMCVTGASNGGLLAGAALVQRPDLWSAVAPVVPIFDMMEPLPLTPETAAVRAIFYEDYGDPAKPDQAPAIMQWSPYHNVKQDRSYPAVFQVFGERDLGCMPFHGRKFTARLRATQSNRPIHLRVWRDVGHGAMDPAIANAQTAEWLSFLMREVGMKPATPSGAI